MRGEEEVEEKVWGEEKSEEEVMVEEEMGEKIGRNEKMEEKVRAEIEHKSDIFPFGRYPTIQYLTFQKIFTFIPQITTSDSIKLSSCFPTLYIVNVYQ